MSSDHLSTFLSAAGGAWVHGRAAERVALRRGVRGATLDDVLAEVAQVWHEPSEPPEPPVLARLPRVDTA